MRKVCRQPIALAIVVSILSCTSVFAAGRSRNAAPPVKLKPIVLIFEMNKAPVKVAGDNTFPRAESKNLATGKNKLTIPPGAKLVVKKIAAKNIRAKKIDVEPGHLTVAPPFQSWECMSTCLQSAGVSLVWILGCAVICIATLGIGCAVCLGVGAGVLTICGQACAHELNN